MDDHRRDVALATLLHDPHGRWGPRIAELLPAALDTFAGTVVVVTSTTAGESASLVAELGAVVERERHEPAGVAGIGRARREAIGLALRAIDASSVLYSDLDHVLRWVAKRPAGLERALAEVARHDFTVLGRRPDVFAALPATLRETEAIVNRVFGAIAGRSWDVLSGVRGLSRRAASVVADDSREDSIGNDVEWPLVALARDLDVAYVEAYGLDYEDEVQFTSPRQRREWVEQLEHSPQAWVQRLEIAKLQLEAIERHLARTDD